MFAKIGVHQPCGIFTKGHFILIILSIIGIITALKFSIKKKKDEVYKIIKGITIFLWILEIIKIIFNISQYSLKNVNNYIPLYYCSILLYAGLLSSYGKGNFKRTGDVFLATGSIIGGIVFLVYPSTSLPSYPIFHFISIHSFIFHSLMVYLGLLVNITNYIELNIKDIKFYALIVGVLCILALVVNNFLDSNLMFVSKNFPGTPIEILYSITNGSYLFNIIIILVQITIPFYLSYYTIKIVKWIKGRTILYLESHTD